MAKTLTEKQVRKIVQQEIFGPAKAAMIIGLVVLTLTMIGLDISAMMGVAEVSDGAWTFSGKAVFFLALGHLIVIVGWIWGCFAE